MIPEKEREALMRLTMCAREECDMCKYTYNCNFDFQRELATKNMNILADALRTADRKTEPTISKMEQVDKDDAYFLELMGAVARGEISDAGANQAWLEYINHKTEPTGYNLSPVEDEPTISKMEQVETMSCQECKHFHENAVMYLDQCDFCFKDCKYEPKDGPQTDCNKCQTYWNCQGQCDEMPQIEDEPQTDCAWGKDE